MAKLHKKTQEVSEYILNNVSLHSSNIAANTANHFGMSRQAVNQHLKRLVEGRFLQSKGVTRNKTYELTSQNLLHKQYSVNDKLNESDVWFKDIAPLLGELPDNVKDIWDYGFTEMLNNVIDHSNSKTVEVYLDKTPVDFKIKIIDFGEGIFKKIQKALDLADERHAVLELAKGKFTTDPENHSGEGIFFSSRVFDKFVIMSGNVHFSHNSESYLDWVLENSQRVSGTVVIMEIKNNAQQKIKDTFDAFASDEDDYGFTQTVVPVKLAQYGDERLVSRSQAKRLLSGLDRFKHIIFDFKDVELIGQAFSDQIFRVYKNQHPEMKFIFINTNKDVDNMINRALSANA